jgi:hypothetical protein
MPSDRVFYHVKPHVSAYVSNSNMDAATTELNGKRILLSIGYNVDSNRVEHY